jgi:hypothetical protein
MKPTTLLSGRFFLLLLTVGLTIGLISWDQKQTPNRNQQTFTDTTPKKKTGDREKKIRDLDQALEELNSENLNVDAEKIQKELADALKDFDGTKIKLEIEKALKEVDLAKIQKEVQESLAKVDFTKIKEEIAEALKEVDLVKIQKDVQESLARVDWDNLKAEIAKVKDIDMKEVNEQMKKLNEEMKEMRPNLEKEMQKVKAELEKTRADMKEFKSFVDGLNDEGLIDKKGTYTLKHKEGELLINGKKAGDATYSKYKNFLEKHPSFNIEKTDDDFDIDMD